MFNPIPPPPPDVKRSHRPMQQPKGRAHPSGMPLHTQRRGVASRIRVPDGPLSPGLQRRGLTEAIGFTAGLTADDYDE